MSKAKKSGKSAHKPVVDVHAPGTAAPSPTSKPVIVSNRPLLQDPMVVEKRNDQEDERPGQDLPTPDIKLSAGDKSKLRPLDDSITGESTPEETVNPPKPKDAAPDSGSVASPTVSPDDQDDVPATGAETSDQLTAESPATEAPNEQTVDGLPKDNAQKKEAAAAEQTARDAAIQKLIDGKQYALPIQTVEQRNSKRVIIMGAVLSVVLLLLWLDIALDAGILHLSGLQPVTNLF